MVTFKSFSVEQKPCSSGFASNFDVLQGQPSHICSLVVKVINFIDTVSEHKEVVLRLLLE